MAGLLDTIKSNLATPGITPGGGQTEEVRGLLRAKLGKATADTGAPQQTAIGEEIALGQARLGLQDVAEKGKIEGAQLGQQQADIRQQASQQVESGRERLADMQQKFSQQATGILDDLEASRDTLDLSRRQAKMDQAGFLIRGMNEQYVRELQKQGSLSRLQDNQAFKYAAAESLFSDNLELLNDDLKFKAFLDAGNREASEALSNMSDDFALKMGDVAIQQAGVLSRTEGMSQAVSAGVSAAKDSGAFKSDGTED